MTDQHIDSGGGWNWSAIPVQRQEEKKPQRARRADRHKYPKPMPEPVVYYGRGDSQYPETIRMSFADGHTEIYDRRVNQPRPDGYVNSPMRRRNKT